MHVEKRRDKEFAMPNNSLEEDPSLRSGQALGPQRSWADVRRDLHVME
jgi:hypothetical protein